MHHSELLEQWDDLLSDPFYSEIPGRLETNNRGEIILASHSSIHSTYQKRIQVILDSYGGGEAFPEVAILTTDGVKVADVAWIEQKNLSMMEGDSCLTACPPLCVEVWSHGNRATERLRKPEIYLNSGAKEVWTCTDGTVKFFDSVGELEASRMFPDFPTRIELFPASL